jgi:GDPmannose 4,6-dehydratase
MTRTFVTGVSGQDGSYLAERLISDGVDVHALVRSRAEPDAQAAVSRHPEVTFHEGDLGDDARIRELLLAIDPDEVYNLAGVSSVAQSWQDPVLTARITGTAVATLLDALWTLQEASGRPRRLLQASSAEMFGTPESSPQDESTPIKPSSPYGAAKAYAHHMAGLYRRRGLFAATCILYNHESPRRPEQFVTRKITASVARIARGTQDRLVLGDLAVRRDWGWAPDYVDAMMRAIRADEASDFVIATGESHSVRDFVAAAFRAVGIDEWEALVESDPGLLRPTDAAELRGDSTRARAILGWHPTRGFDEIVAAMIEADLRDTGGNG